MDDARRPEADKGRSIIRIRRAGTWLTAVPLSFVLLEPGRRLAPNKDLRLQGLIRSQQLSLTAFYAGTQTSSTPIHVPAGTGNDQSFDAEALCVWFDSRGHIRQAVSTPSVADATGTLTPTRMTHFWIAVQSQFPLESSQDRDPANQNIQSGRDHPGPNRRRRRRISTFMKKRLLSRGFDGVEVGGLCGVAGEGVGVWAR